MSQEEVHDFIAKWQRAELKEQAGAQEHFIDICRLVDHPTPATADPKGESFTFERAVQKLQGGRGRADVWKKGTFAWEYKGPDKDLDAAYNQLLQYRESLENPCLLVVSDYQHFRIHTNFQNAAHRVYEFEVEDLAQPSVYHYLHALFHDPDALHPREHADDVTKDAAAKFADLADSLRRGYAPRKVAHFLTQTVFSLFAEDIDLLPRGESRLGIFTELIRNTQGDRYHHFPGYARQLFNAMATGGDVQFRQIAHFNGGLFKPGNNDFIPDLTVEQLALLMDAARLDWSAIRPSIFGTLFERGLDPAKRSQLGAHYTSRQDIEAIVEPVLMAPLRREWTSIQNDLVGAVREPPSLPTIRDDFLHKLASTRVLDPACGSGNFLYVSLNLLKDLEKQVITHEAFADLPPVEPRFVTPVQLYGIEISEYAHELASVVVWIGYIQWFRNNGYDYTQRPILQKLDNIECKDAILGQHEDGTLYQPDWPEAEVIVGNPPFLGDKKMRGELGNDYVEKLRGFYDGRIPGQSDLVCYWFECAREQLANERVERAGLLATQGIRGGANRTVLDRVKADGDIFFAISDRDWIQEGTSVHVSMIGFDNGNEHIKLLDGTKVSQINPDLSSEVDLSIAKALSENQDIGFIGTQKSGAFDISGQTAEAFLNAPVNPNGRPNNDVIKKYANAVDITQRWRGYYIVDFYEMSEEDAALYVAPFEYIKENVKPGRDATKSRGIDWWLHERPRPAMREAISPLTRYIVTPSLSKHRVFVWLTPDVLPDHQLFTFARDDDYFFGVLHSRLHEVWARRQGTQLRERESGFRYTSTTTFQTFPFPWPPGQEPTGDPHYLAIAGAARELHQKREAWLNPPGAEVATLRQRTLTKLYNALQDGKATWLALLHEKLDRAVCAAYGWDYDDLVTEEHGVNEEEILRRLLALNLARAENQS